MENKILKSFQIKENVRFEIVEGDLLKEKTEVIVNAANSYLVHGGGIAAIIEAQAGEEFTKEGDKIVKEKGPVPVGDAVITTAGKLPFKGIIHAVGPRLGEGEEEEKLKKAIKAVLMIASENKFKTLSFPAISSGIFRVPKEICARAYLKGVLEFFKENEKTSLNLVRLVLYNDQTMAKLVENLASSFNLQQNYKP